MYETDVRGLNHAKRNSAGTTYGSNEMPRNAFHLASSRKHHNRRNSGSLHFPWNNLSSPSRKRQKHRFQLSELGIKPLPDRVKCILEFPQPVTLSQLPRYLGLFNFIRRCISKAADILDPLVRILEDDKNKKKHPCTNAHYSTEQLEWNDDERRDRGATR
ncbi:transposon Ty3-I Gag-Pol polyprotein [Nephila pilipes]|uniref:Transposon Ty3-I Gag-Pol polyprotein n=1 Tax=Nephila pilipes TaxID=299642 RepID=A0A8X6UDC5_NEPPI|nr:transposon Ty3-I Gag-Pol polyprotein [Nephila pilipes]